MVPHSPAGSCPVPGHFPRLSPQPPPVPPSAQAAPGEVVPYSRGEAFTVQQGVKLLQKRNQCSNGEISGCALQFLPNLMCL